MSDVEEVIWRANAGPQSWLISCPIFEVFYGGARGGGKTAGMLGEWLNHSQRWGEDASGLVVRRERTQLVEMVEESKRIFSRLGGVYHEADKYWRMVNGARLRFAYLESDADAEAYQGQAFTRLYVEELGNFPRPEPVMKLMATLRSSAGVPVGFRATGNPGGPGHSWVKQRYIDPWPAGMRVLSEVYGNPFDGSEVVRERVFIPALLKDNPHLPADYVANLQMQGSEALTRAWLHGDWSVIEGAFFGEWQMSRHVVEPMGLPKEWVRYRAADWGSAKPFAVYWIAVSDGSLAQFARGALVVYREWYGVAVGANGQYKPDVGVKLTAEEVADGIREREAGDERIDFSVLDPSAFANHGGPSIAERMAVRGVQFHRADNTRVGVRGAMSGWDQVRARLKGDEDGNAMIHFFSTCIHAIRTLPSMQHDLMRPEDLDTDGEDHCFAAGTLVATPDGPQAVETLSSGVCQTRFGARAFRNGGPRAVRAIVSVKLTDGTEIRCTPDHQFLTLHGWIEAQYLSGLSLVRASSALKRKNSSVGDTTCVDGTFSARACAFIARYGARITATFLAAITFITWMLIAPTTRRKTWRYCLPKRICESTDTLTLIGLLPLAARVVLPPPHGIAAMLDASGIASIAPGSIFAASASSWCASIAQRITRHTSLVRLALSSAARTAKPVRCVGVDRLSAEPTYCITVPDCGEFILANGVVTSNSVDAIRYSCLARPWVRAVPPVAGAAPVLRGRLQRTLNEIIAARTKARREAEA